MVKTVVNTPEVAHLWANGIQPHARNPNNSFYYDGKDIFSYGSHYLAARMYFPTKTQRAKFALVNSYRYSPTTARHLYHIRDALRNNVQYFQVPKPDSIPDAIAYLDKLARDTLKGLQTWRRPISEADSLDALKHSMRMFAVASDLRTLVGRKPIHPAKSDWLKATKQMRFLAKRHAELNSPAMLAKKAREKEKRQAARAAKLEKTLAVDVENWKNGGPAKSSLRDLSFDLVRASRDESTVETSRGVHVSYDAAADVYFRIKRGEALEGKQIGGYTVSKIETLPDGEKTVTIGCHTFKMSDAAKVFDV